MSRFDKIRKKDRLVYTKTEKEKPERNGNWFKLLLVFLTSGGIIYFMFFSGFFDIRNIEVEGYSYPETIKEETDIYINGGLTRRNIFIFRSRKLKEAFYGDGSIKTIEVKKVYPSKIKIRIEEYKPAIIWISAGEKYLINEGGEVIDKASDQILAEVTDASNIKVERGERIASPTLVKFINLIGEGFETATGSKVIKITIYDILTDVHILTSDGWTVYLDASKDPAAQLKNLARVLEEVRKSGKKIQYIDLRLDTKAYYK